jgi:hypothetical protein
MDKSSFESTHAFFDMWLKTYETTYGRLIEMPAMGPMHICTWLLMKRGM